MKNEWIIIGVVVVAAIDSFFVAKQASSIVAICNTHCTQRIKKTQMRKSGE
jgi:hypothetical protein